MLSFVSLGQIVTTYVVPVVLGLLVFFIGRKISSKLGVAAEQAFNKTPNADPTLSRFFASIIKFIFLFMVIMIALGVVGVDTSGLGGMLIGAGAAIAFILKDSLSDLAAGVMLVLMRPFSVGDEVEIGGHKGVVLEIGLLATRMKTRDDIAIIVANGKAWGGIIRNHNALENRRLDRVYHVSFNANIDKAIKTLIKTAAADPRVHQDPAPWAKVVDIGDSSIGIELRVWCDYIDFRNLAVELPQPITKALDKSGTGIPYPVEVKQKLQMNRAARARS